MAKGKIVVFIGSNSTNSIHRALVNVLLADVQNWNFEIVDLAQYNLPLFGVDIEKQGIPPIVSEINDAFASADGFIVACPEYNSSIPGYFKNTLDWLSRVQKKVFREKPVLLITASNGARAGASVRQHLERVMPYWGAKNVTSHGFGRFGERFDLDQNRFFSEEDAVVTQQWIEEFLSAL